MINATIIKFDGMPITFTKPTWKEAIAEVVRMADDSFYSRAGFWRIALVSDQSGPEMFTLAELRKTQAEGSAPDNG